MEAEDFKRGEAKAKLENITEDVVEIKETMKEHNAKDEKEFEKLNSKVDRVADLTEEAADNASNAEQRVRHQEKIVDDRHEDNKKHLERIEAKVDKLTDDQSDMKLKMYVMAVLLGSSGGAAIDLLKGFFS